MTDDDIDVLHLMTPDGCRISVNGQGHLPCSLHVWDAAWNHCYEDHNAPGADHGPCGRMPVTTRLDPEDGKPYPVCGTHDRP